MAQVFDIEALVADAKPVRRMRGSDGALIVLGITLAMAIGVAVFLDLRPDIKAMHPDAMALVRSGTLLLLGVATLSAVVGSARPNIGHRAEGWMWALCAALLFPLASLVLVGAGDPMPMQEVMQPSGMECLMTSSLGALAIAGPLILWLRRGAVTRPTRTAWLVGLCAGAFGSLAYSLHCPMNSIHYIAFWYSSAILISALAGRLVVAPLLRW